MIKYIITFLLVSLSLISLRASNSMNESSFNFIGKSDEIIKLKSQIKKIAKGNLSVILMGETGTGKEIVAKTTHAQSERTGNFIAINCAAIPHTLIESILFGHKKGAFTGAYANKKGAFELSHNGTIFLDEIGELPKNLQTKILTVLDKGEVTPVGETKPVKVNIRVISATNKDLQKEVVKGNFRQDLYFRLNGFQLKLPLLKDRGKDILLLAEHFITKYSLKNDKNIKPLSNLAKSYLLKYKWPGNVRELENRIERAIIMSKGERLENFDLFPKPKKNHHIMVPYKDFKNAVLENFISKTLEANDNNLTRAAKSMNVHRTHLSPMNRKRIKTPTDLSKSITFKAKISSKSRPLSENEILQVKKIMGNNFMVNSDWVLDFSKDLKNAANSNAKILLTGETGSGKTILAKAVHNNSPVKNGAFVSVNCNAISDGLFESTFFGHAKGSFTGASSARNGLFQKAHNGTLFIDEIGELPKNMQAKLLRVIQDGQITPVGSERPIKVNVRIISATNQNLKKLVEKGKFRRDLFYRINTIKLSPPPLSERPSDIEFLSKHFLEKYLKQTGLKEQKNLNFSDNAIKAMKNYSWPGNVRELKAAVFRGATLANNDGTIHTEELNLNNSLFKNKERVPTAKYLKAEIDSIVDSNISLKEMKNRSTIKALVLALKAGITITKAAEILKSQRTHINEIVSWANIGWKDDSLYFKSSNQPITDKSIKVEAKNLTEIQIQISQIAKKLKNSESISSEIKDLLYYSKNGYINTIRREISIKNKFSTKHKDMLFSILNLKKNIKLGSKNLNLLKSQIKNHKEHISYGKVLKHVRNIQKRRGTRSEIKLNLLTPAEANKIIGKAEGKVIVHDSGKVEAFLINRGTKNNPLVLKEAYLHEMSHIIQVSKHPKKIVDYVSERKLEKITDKVTGIKPNLVVQTAAGIPIIYAAELVTAGFYEGIDKLFGIEGRGSFSDSLKEFKKPKKHLSMGALATTAASIRALSEHTIKNKVLKSVTSHGVGMMAALEAASVVDTTISARKGEALSDLKDHATVEHATIITFGGASFLAGRQTVNILKKAPISSSKFFRTLATLKKLNKGRRIAGAALNAVSFGALTIKLVAEESAVFILAEAYNRLAHNKIKKLLIGKDKKSIFRKILKFKKDIEKSKGSIDELEMDFKLVELRNLFEVYNALLLTNYEEEFSKYIEKKQDIAQKNMLRVFLTLKTKDEQIKILDALKLEIEQESNPTEKENKKDLYNNLNSVNLELVKEMDRLFPCNQGNCSRALTPKDQNIDNLIDLETNLIESTTNNNWTKKQELMNLLESMKDEQATLDNHLSQLNKMKKTIGDFSDKSLKSAKNKYKPKNKEVLRPKNLQEMYAFNEWVLKSLTKNFKSNKYKSRTKTTIKIKLNLERKRNKKIQNIVKESW